MTIGQEIRRSLSDSLDFLTRNLIQKRQRDAKAEKLSNSANAAANAAVNKNVFEAAKILAQHKAPEGVSALQRFMQSGGSPDVFAGTTPQDPNQLRALSDAEKFTKIGLPNEQIDFSRAMLNRAGLPGNTLSAAPTKNSLAVMRNAQARLAETRGKELKRLNDARIKKLIADANKREAEAKKILSKGVNKDSLNEYIKLMDESLKTIENQLDPNNPISVERYYRNDKGVITGDNPAWLELKNDYDRLSQKLQIVTSYKAGLEPIQKQAIDDKKKQEIINNLRIIGRQPTEEAIKAIMENPDFMTELKRRAMIQQGVIQ